MEDVLEVYQRPYDGNEVLVCMDETSKQQVKETRVPRPAAPGLSAAYDYEYERNGVSSLGMIGKRAFVTYYELLADFDLPDNEVADLIASELDSTFDSAMTWRVKPARTLIRAGQAKTALLIVSRSARLSNDITRMASELALGTATQ